MGRLTTHVLDTAQGKPGAGIVVEVYSIEAERKLVRQSRTNADGRTEQPMLEEHEFAAGTWELVFHVGSYFAGQGLGRCDPPFLDEVIIRFGIAQADQHYHVPLLVSPWSYTTYRGS